MTKVQKLISKILIGSAILVAVGIVGENDYQDELVAAHNKCTEFPRLTECRNYDPEPYLDMMESKK